MDEDWKREVQSRLSRLERNDAVEAVHRENMFKRLGNIEDLLKWVLRAFFGGIILAFLRFMLNGGLNV